LKKEKEAFADEASVERLLYLLLKELNERLKSRKLRGFKENESGELPCSSWRIFYTIKSTLWLITFNRPIYIQILVYNLFRVDKTSRFKNKTLL